MAEGDCLEVVMTRAEYWNELREFAIWICMSSYLLGTEERSEFCLSLDVQGGTGCTHRIFTVSCSIGMVLWRL